MSAIRGCIVAATLAALVGGCGTQFSGSIGSVSVSRNNDELTVRFGNEPVTQGSGTIAKEQRTTTAFRKVAAQHGVRVQIEEGPADSITVETDNNLLPLVETKVENETLQVRVLGSLSTRNPIRVTVIARQLSDVSAGSSASVTAKKVAGDRVHLDAGSSGQISIDDLQGDQIVLESTSSGEVRASKVAGKTLRVAVSSSGRVTAAGNVDELHAEASSSGSYEGAGLASRSARVECSSSGSAAVNATKEVSGSASSSGHIRYTGDPAKVSVETSSSGSVAKAGG